MEPGEKTNRTFTFDQITALFAALKADGVVLGRKHYRIMADIPGHKTTANCEHLFRNAIEHANTVYTHRDLPGNKNDEPDTTLNEESLRAQYEACESAFTATSTSEMKDEHFRFRAWAAETGFHVRKDGSEDTPPSSNPLEGLLKLGTSELSLLARVFDSLCDLVQQTQHGMETDDEAHSHHPGADHGLHRGDQSDTEPSEHIRTPCELVASHISTLFSFLTLIYLPPSSTDWELIANGKPVEGLYNVLEVAAAASTAAPKLAGSNVDCNSWLKVRLAQALTARRERLSRSCAKSGGRMVGQRHLELTYDCDDDDAMQAFTEEAPRQALFMAPQKAQPCPHCGEPCGPCGERAWMCHELADLMPYVCVFQPCGLNMFGSRKEWLKHDREHRGVWICLLCKGHSSNDSDALEAHLRAAHAKEVTEVSIPYLVQGGFQYVERVPATSCPFCDWHGDTSWDDDTSDTSDQTISYAEFGKHVARHLEAITDATMSPNKGTKTGPGEDVTMTGYIEID